MPNNELLSPCGLYCGSCGIYMATIENNRELKENLTVSYKIDINEINCFGFFLKILLNRVKTARSGTV